MQRREIKAVALPLDEVLALYKAAGYDIENEEIEVPNVLPVEGKEWFFTGDLIPSVGDDGKPFYLEIVIIAEWFRWDDVVSDMDDEDEDKSDVN